MNYDPWQNVKTRNGFDADLVISADLLKNLCIKGFAMVELPVIPDVAYDKHARKGQEMGRDSFHFLNEASIVIPQMEIDNDYKERYLKLLEKYDPENVSDTAFKYNSWQY